MKLLEVKDLHVSVDDKEILKGLNLDINEGEIHVLMGPNGAGKSTLANAILNNSEYKITGGDIIFNNENITNLKTYEIARKGILLSFQSPEEIPGLSVLNFIRVIKSNFNNETISSFMIKDEIIDKMKNLNMKEEYITREVNVGFSGGEKKKNEMLQMLMLNPKLIILDEIDSGLDVDAIKDVASSIKALKNDNNSFLIITHSNRLIDELDVTNVSIIEDGKIIKNGDSTLINKIFEEGFNNE